MPTNEVMQMATRRAKTVCETVGGEPYEFLPLGNHVVSAPGVCEGEPTFKYTRIGVRHALELLAGGRTVKEVAQAYRIPVEAVQESLDLAAEALCARAA